MRPHHAWILALVLLGGCATNPLRIPPPPHALPSRPRLVAIEARGDEGVAPTPESRPAVVPAGYAAPAQGEPWREGDRVAFALDFDDGPKRESFWLVLEVTRGPRDEGDLARATVKTTLLDACGTEIGTAVKRVAPARIEDAAAEIAAAYSGLIAQARQGVAPECLQDVIDEDFAEGSEFDDARRRAARELKRTAAPRFVRERLKEPAIAASIGSLTVFDLAMAALAPVEILVDVNRLAQEQDSLENFSDVPVASKIRVPLVMSIGGNIQFRFAITVGEAAPPYSLAGGLLEVAGVNEARGDRNFLVRLVAATRGAAESRATAPPAAESRAAESRGDDEE